MVGRAEPAFPVPHEWSFFKPNRGVVCRIDTIEKTNGNDVSFLEKQTFSWNAFNHLDTTLDITLNEINETSLSAEETDVGVEEGRERFSMRKHKWYERRPEKIKEAKRLAGIENRLFCEACGFNFATTYPMLGNGFIECHHRTPIASGGIRQTRVRDLALVCSNCHRMLHKKLQGYGYLTVEELRERFFKAD